MKPGMKRDAYLAKWLRDNRLSGKVYHLDLTFNGTYHVIAQLAASLGLIEFSHIECESDAIRALHYIMVYRLTPIGEIYINENIPLARNEAQDTLPASDPVGDDGIPRVQFTPKPEILNYQINNLREQLAERNEDYRVLQDDMRRMADENQRLRAFVEQIADQQTYVHTYPENEALHSVIAYIKKAATRALLDTETD